MFGITTQADRDFQASVLKYLAAISEGVTKMADELSDIKTALDAVQTAATAAAAEITKLAGEIANLNPVDTVARQALVDEANTIATNLNAAATAGG